MTPPAWRAVATTTPDGLTPTVAPTVGAPGLANLVRTVPRPPKARENVLTIMQSGHGWASAGSGTVSDDTADFVLGTQSQRIVTAGLGTSARSRKTTLTGVDLNANDLQITVKVDASSRLSDCQVYVASDTAFTNSASGTVAPGSVLGATSNTPGGLSGGEMPMPEFVTITVAKELLTTVTGSPNLAAIVAAQVTFLDSGSGNVVTARIQKIALVPRPASGVISLIFDDGYVNNMAAAAHMDRYGFRATLAVIRDRITAADPAFLSLAQMRRLHDASGWDMCVHADTLAHHNSANGLVDLSTTNGSADGKTPSDFLSDVLRCKQWLLAQGFRGVDHLVWPKGRFTAAHRAAAAPYFTTMRGYRSAIVLNEAETWPPPDPLRLRTMGVTGGATPDSAASVNSAVDAAMTAKRALLLSFHDPKADVSDGQATSYPLASFQSIIDNIATKGYRVKTLTELCRDGVA